jgi:hypothetical protein
VAVAAAVVVVASSKNAYGLTDSALVTDMRVIIDAHWVMACLRVLHQRSPGAQQCNSLTAQMPLLLLLLLT